MKVGCNSTPGCRRDPLRWHVVFAEHGRLPQSRAARSLISPNPMLACSLLNGETRLPSRLPGRMSAKTHRRLSCATRCCAAASCITIGSVIFRCKHLLSVILKCFDRPYSCPQSTSFPKECFRHSRRLLASSHLERQEFEMARMLLHEPSIPFCDLHMLTARQKWRGELFYASISLSQFT
jgi:hypothetical protein